MTEFAQHVPVCTASEAESIAAQVNELHRDWIARDASGLFTLGAAAYLDAPTAETVTKFGLSPPDSDTYLNRLECYNPVLVAAFEALYARLRLTLAEYLHAKVDYAADKALPGFHIFNHHPHYSLPGSHVAHYDRQYENLSWSQPVDVGTARTISFTLPVKIPESGAGIHLWDVHLQDILGLQKSAAVATIKQARSWREPYTVGTMFCHPGHQLHRIAPWKSDPGEQRITLQGHGIYINNGWQLYW